MNSLRPSARGASSPTGGTFTVADHPRQRDGRFAATTRLESADVDITTDDPVCEICGERTDAKDQHGTLMCEDCQDDAEICAVENCNADLADNEGWDGYCGWHADLIENHSDGSHEPENDGPDDDCPTCNGL